MEASEQNAVVFYNDKRSAFEVRFYKCGLDACIALTRIEFSYKMLITHDEGVIVDYLIKSGLRIEMLLYINDLEKKYRQ